MGMRIEYVHNPHDGKFIDNIEIAGERIFSAHADWYVDSVEFVDDIPVTEMDYLKVTLRKRDTSNDLIEEKRNEED